MNSFKNANKSLNELSGIIGIDFDLIMSNLNDFNSKFNAPFTSNTSRQEIIDFIGHEYIKITQDLLFENQNANSVFNNKFKPYSIIE